MMKMQTDVLIIGAGPVGMLLALMLKHNGIQVRLIEKRLARSQATRAIAINQATLDVFAILGLQDLIHSGEIVKQIEVFWDKKRVTQVGFDALDIEHPYFFHLPQNQIEQCLEEKITQAGILIEKGMALVNYTQNETGIVASIQNQSGSNTEIYADYLVGCDGGQSSVRAGLSVPVDVEQYHASFILADITFKDQKFQRTQYYFTQAGYAMIVPLPENKYRLIFSLKSPQKELLLEAFETDAIEVIHNLLSERAGVNVEIDQIIWSTSAPYGHRLSTEVGQGRVLLAGDAMHQFSPVGGTNLNAGIQDVFSVAWRLVASIQDNEPLALNAYQAERSVFVAEQQYMTKWATALMTRSKCYPESTQFKPPQALDVLQRRLTGFVEANTLKHIQLLLPQRVLKVYLPVLRAHFLNMQHVLIISDQLSASLLSASQQWCVEHKKIKWVKMPLKGSVKFYRCRPDALVTASGDEKQLKQLVSGVTL